MGVALLVAGLAGAAAAHRLAPSLLDVRERAPGRLEVLWKTPLQRPTGTDLRPELPAGCAPLGEATPEVAGSAALLRWSVDCGPAGMVGRRFAVRGLAASRTEALLRVELADGRALQAVLRGGDEEFTVPEREQRLEVARDYAGLGFRHILDGLDHLAFVLGLVLLVPAGRRLVGTITAFTLGHSVTLSLAALGFFGLPPTLVELGIAASILVLALDLVRGPHAPPSALRRRPWAVAGAFGLLHGLGFARALREAGLPAGEIPAALLSFNVGIELGQLAFVGVVLLAAPALRALARPGPAWLAGVPAHAIGALAAFWCIERTVSLF